MGFLTKLGRGAVSPPPLPKQVYDFELCFGKNDLIRCFADINANGHRLISVTQDAAGLYTVFFSRFAYGEGTA